MHKKFEINQTKIKGSCQSGRKEVPQDSKSDLPLDVLVTDTIGSEKNEMFVSWNHEKLIGILLWLL